jgi:negative regulator of sigma E activity
MLGHRPVLRAAQRFILVVGVGALGAAVCATVILVAGVGDKQGVRTVPKGNAPAPTPRPLSAAETAAVALLRNAAAAAAALHYRGKKLFGSWTSTGDTSVLADVEHIPGRGTWVSVTSAGGGNRVHPRPGRGESPEGELTEDGLERPGPEALGALTNHYTVRAGGPVPCAGRLATVIEATGITRARVAGRFWIDRETGILLRHELYDSAGRQIRVIAFLDLTVERAGRPAPGPGQPVASEVPRAQRTPPARKKRSSLRQLLGQSDLARLRRSGWVVPETLPGGLQLYRAHQVQAGGGQTVQLTYSDGLFTASLFAQRGRLERSSLRGFAQTRIGDVVVHSRPGLYRQLVWAGGDTVYTLVTDVPDAAVGEIVAMLPHSTGEPDLLSRVGRGIDRMGSWINPFE